MSQILNEGLAAAAVEHQSKFSPRLGLVRDLCDEIIRLENNLITFKDQLTEAKAELAITRGEVLKLYNQIERIQHGFET